ncbi:MAG: hypothetical protein RQ761_03395 [Bacteroidales bacterium]|nr:hypothetical protein [Bacteroidales bacterium]
MKRIFFTLMVLGFILVFTQCDNSKKDNRTIITKKIQYDVPIVNREPDYDWWIKNIEGSDREALVNNIFDRVLAGDVQAYDYFHKPINVDAVKKILVDTAYHTLVRPIQPFNEYDTMIIHNIEPNQVSLLRFLEEWKYDENSLKIDKRIYAISPVIEMTVNGKKVTRPLFWIYTDDSILKK